MVTRKKTPPGLKESVNDIWLAGLGAFNLAGEEGGKLFKQLVKRGQAQQDANKEMLEGITERVQGLKEDAKEALGKVAAPFEDGLAKAMQGLGVPTRKEILALTRRVEDLTRNVTRAKAAAAPKPKPKPAPKKAAPKKAAPRPKAKAKPRARATEQAQATT